MLMFKKTLARLLSAVLMLVVFGTITNALLSRYSHDYIAAKQELQNRLGQQLADQSTTKEIDNHAKQLDEQTEQEGHTALTDKQTEKNNADKQNLQTETAPPSTTTSSGTGSTIHQWLNAGVNLWKKAEQVASGMGKATSMFDSDVSIVRKMSFTKEGSTFTLDELFNGILDHPTWKSQKVDGYNVVMVTGGVSKLMEDPNNSVKSELQQVLHPSSQTSLDMTVIFPVQKGKVVAEQIGSYLETPGTGKIKLPGSGTAIIDQLSMLYQSEVKKHD
jgi:hypothetical protein